MMKRILLLCIYLFASCFILNAQIIQEETNPDILQPSSTTVNGEEVFTVVEQMPEFIGGDKAMNDFFANNIKYPEIARDQGIQGKVWIHFIIDKEGNIVNPQIKRGIGGGCNEEALRVVKEMPKWRPGYQNGKPVAVKFTMPVTFTIK